MHNFRLQDRAAPNLSCAVELKVNVAHLEPSKMFFSSLLNDDLREHIMPRTAL
jgi:hypothetical protein